MKCRNTHEPASLALKQRKEMQKKNAVTLDFIAQELRGCWDPWGQLLDAHQYQKLWLVWPPFAHSIERVPYLEWWSIFLWMGTPLRTLRHHTVGPVSMDWHSSLARNKPRNCLHQTWARWGGPAQRVEEGLENFCSEWSRSGMSQQVTEEEEYKELLEASWVVSSIYNSSNSTSMSLGRMLRSSR